MRSTRALETCALHFLYGYLWCFFSSFSSLFCTYWPLVERPSIESTCRHYPKYTKTHEKMKCILLYPSTNTRIYRCVSSVAVRHPHNSIYFNKTKKGKKPPSDKESHFKRPSKVYTSVHYVGAQISIVIGYCHFQLIVCNRCHYVDSRRGTEITATTNWKHTHTIAPEPAATNYPNRAAKDKNKKLKPIMI